MPPKKQKNDNEMKSWYTIIPDSLKTKYHNPCYENHKLEVPFRMMIVGSSGSGKTTLVLEIIHRMNDTFGHITICCANKQEPLYEYLVSKLEPEQLTVVEGYQNIPDLKALDEEVQHLIVFDDLVLERRQDKIEEYYIRSRKIAKGVSCIYLTQSYFAVPKTIRLQCGYILLKKLSSMRDLGFIVNDFNVGIEKEDLFEMYRHATDNQRDFLLVDMVCPPEERFRLNFLNIIDVSQFLQL